MIKEARPDGEAVRDEVRDRVRIVRRLLCAGKLWQSDKCNAETG
jgi:hypothetical protein